jgi:preprotein translocase subunit SecG
VSHRHGAKPWRSKIKIKKLHNVYGSLSDLSVSVVKFKEVVAMRFLLTSLHVIVSTILIAMVLLQKGKGADIGAAFGGASNTVFGPRGAQSFLAKLTTSAAIVFMITSLFLAITSSKKSSVMESVTPPAQTQQSPVQLPPPGAAPAQK